MRIPHLATLVVCDALPAEEGEGPVSERKSEGMSLLASDSFASPLCACGVLTTVGTAAAAASPRMLFLWYCNI